MCPRERRSVSRRQLLRGGIVVGVGSVAGCLDALSEDAPAENDDDERPDYEPVEHPGDEPMTPPEDYRCPVCNMLPHQYSSTNAQLVHENGHGKFFDSAGCLFGYYADPGTYDGPDSEIENVWATGSKTGELIDATELYFVLDPHRNNDPMDSPVPFAERDDAVEYVNSYDDVSEDDIADLEAADSEKADPFRR